MVVTPPIVQTPTTVEVALDRPPQPTAYPLGMGQKAMELGVVAKVTKGLAQGGRTQPIGGTHISLQCFKCQGWDHMAGDCPTPASALNQPVGN